MPAAEQSTLSIPVGPVRIAVVVVTYDAPPQLLEQCVEALLATTDRTTVEVIVVDTGGAAHRRLRDSGDAVTVLDLGVNAGFAAAVNAGFEVGLDDGAQVLVSLNDDVLVQRGWLEPLVDALAAGSASHLGAVQPLLVQLGSEPAEINSAGVEIDRFGAGSDRLRACPVGDAGPARLDAVTGGAAAWSAAFVRDVGPADERFV
ncbi:MAG: glycosyltransferase, partial [Actinomycetota bacterium]